MAINDKCTRRTFLSSAKGVFRFPLRPGEEKIIATELVKLSKAHLD